MSVFRWIWLLPLVLHTTAGAAQPHVTTPMITHPTAAKLAPDEDPVVRAAIIVLRAIAEPEGGESPFDRVRVLPDLAIVDDEGAAALLSRMPKPIECLPRFAGDVLEISCSPVAPERMWLLEEVNRARVQAAFGSHPSEYESYLRARTGRVVVLGTDEYISLTLSELQRLESCFVFRGRYSIHIGSPQDLGVRGITEQWIRWYRASEREALR